MMKLSQATLLLTVMVLGTTTATQQYASYSSHSDSSCSSAPKQVAYMASSDCTASDATTCTVSDASSSSAQLYLSTGCVTDPAARTTALFDGKPFVQFDIYAPDLSCASSSRTSSIGYAADGSCLVVDDGTSSVLATVFANKSALVVTYAGSTCSGTPTKTNYVDASDVQKATCLGGVLLASTSTSATTTNVTTAGSSAPSTLQQRMGPFGCSSSMLLTALFTIATSLAW